MKRLLPTAIALLAAPIVFSLLVGCEDDPSPGGPLVIDPADSTLWDDGATATFSVRGGDPPYAWSITDDTLGALTPTGITSAITVTYTREVKSGINTVEVKDNHGWAARATVFQNDIELAIDPNTHSLSEDGDKVVLRGTGGRGPYDWSLADYTRGRITIRNWREAVYTRRATGNNTVIMVDADRRTAIAVITQPTVAALAISPSNPSVSTNGGATVLQAVGGTEPFTWSLASGPAPTLWNPASQVGGTMLLTFGGPETTTSIIRVTDGASEIAFATISRSN